MRPYHLIGDPRIDPPEPKLCGECDWVKGDNPDCPECVRFAELRDDAMAERARRERDHSDD